MIYTQALHHEATEYLARTWVGQRFSHDARHRIVAIALPTFIERTGDSPSIMPMHEPIVREVYVDLRKRQALPFLAWVLIGWAVQKLLDWLWGRYVDEALIIAASYRAERPRKRKHDRHD